MSSIRILLVDDHAVLRAGLRALLGKFPDLEVVGEAGDGAEAVARVNELKPDVVVMDVAMPGINGLVATRQILQTHPETKIIILSQYDNKEFVLPLLKLGAASYVLKQSADTELVTAVYAVARGESALGPPIAKIVLDAFLHENAANPEDPFFELTEREREVLILVAQGHTTPQVAAKLNISPNTVNVHRSKLMQKLGLHNVAEVTAFAIRRGLISN